MRTRAANDRRAASRGEIAPPGAVRRLVAALWAGLYRPLAGDDDRVAYWLGRVRIGVLVSEMASWSVVGYVLMTDSPGRDSLTILIALGLVIVACVSFTLICAMASANSWAAYDRQVALIRQLEALAATDALTAIPNRRVFLDRVDAAVSDAAWKHPTVAAWSTSTAARRSTTPGGYAAGDAVLEAGPTALGTAVRKTDTVARLGGDEFAVLADLSMAFSGSMLAERLRKAVAGAGGATGVTASVGVAEVQPGDDVQDLLHRADAAMYRSKVAGGDRVTALSS